MYRRLCLLGCCLCTALLSPSVMAFNDNNLPDLASDTEPAEDENKNPIRHFLDVSCDALKAIRKGTVATDFAEVHYRMGTKNLKTSFQYGEFDTKIQLGYS